jgi:2-desacetyl-2-hydroxyethyl bacteriochlorophyllide A dehydrogenase
MSAIEAIIFNDVNEVSVAPVEIPEAGAGELLLEAVFTLISPGTELRCLAGKEAGLRFPFIPGYSFLGSVVAQGPGTTLPIGTLAFCTGTAKASVNLGWGGHCGLAVRSESEVYPLPQNVDPLWGAAAKLAAIAYRGVRLARPQPHETVAIVGLGAIGQCSARLFALSGARVIAADLSAARVDIARQAGIEAFVPQDTLPAAFQEFVPGGADIVVDATGVPSVLKQALHVAREKAWDDSVAPGARIIIQGSYPDEFSIPYRTAFMKELSFQIPRDVQPRDLHTVFDLLARGKLNLEGIISAVYPPEAAPQTYAALAEKDPALVTAAFKWRELSRRG